MIHTVGPVWHGGTHGEREQLVSCYRTSLALAKAHDCETVAFPLISSGVYGYPKDQALRVAVDTIGEFLLNNDMTVYLVIFDRKSYQISGKLFADIAEYIDDHYVDVHADAMSECRRGMSIFGSRGKAVCEEAKSMPMMAPSFVGGLDDLLAHLDAGFSETLLKLIDKSGKRTPRSIKRPTLTASCSPKSEIIRTTNPPKPRPLPSPSLWSWIWTRHATSSPAQATLSAPAASSM